MLPIPIGTDRPQRRLPLMNYFIIVVNVLCYVLSHASTRGGGHLGAAGLASGWDGYLLSPAHLRLEQFITYQFLHENISHIFFNMLFLYVFGNNLNEKLGHVGYLAFYLAGGILAGCGQVLSSNSPTLGASGAISAVAGMYLVLLPRTNIRMFIWIFVYVDVWEIPSVYFIFFSVLKDFFEPLLWGANQTAHAAHLSGNFAGFGIGMFLLLAGLVQRDHYDLVASFDRWRRRKQYEALVARGYDPFSPTAQLRPTKGRGTKAGGAAADPDALLRPLREKISMAVREQNLPLAAATFRELRALDPQHILPPEEQLDVANQFMAQSQYTEAAAAYEDFLRVYPGRQQREQVTLVLAVINAHYLANRDRAITLLRAVLPSLHDEHQKRWTEEELAHLQAIPNDAPPPALDKSDRRNPGKLL